MNSSPGKKPEPTKPEVKPEGAKKQAFEQSLARANVASMLKPGGYVLSNDKLADAVPSDLQLVMTIDIPMTDAPVIADHVYCYRRN